MVEVAECTLAAVAAGHTLAAAVAGHTSAAVAVEHTLVAEAVEYKPVAEVAECTQFGAAAAAQLRLGVAVLVVEQRQLVADKWAGQHTPELLLSFRLQFSLQALVVSLQSWHSKLHLLRS